MIIVLKNAVFSANNIGHIDMPIEIDADIQSLLANYSKALSLEKQFAVQSFIKTLRSTGVMSKLHGLYLPILAGQLNESFVNCIDGESHSVTYSPNADSYQLSSYGVNRYADGNEIVLDVISQNSGGNISFFSLSNITDATNQAPVPYFGSQNKCRFVFTKSSLKESAYFSLEHTYVGSYVKLQTLLSNINKSPSMVDTKIINDPIIYAVSLVPGHVYTYKCINEETGTGVVDFPLSTEIDSTIQVFKLDTALLPRIYSPLSIVAIGDGLTPTELITLGEASKTLRKAILQ